MANAIPPARYPGRRSHRQAEPGFTLIELLVVIAIIAVLAALIFPVLGRMREKANLSKCSNNLRQLCVALNAYVAEHGRYPDNPDDTNLMALAGNPPRKIPRSVR